MTREYVTDPAESKSATRPSGPAGWLSRSAKGLGDGVAVPEGEGLGVGVPTSSCGARAWARLIAASSRFCASP